MPQEQAKNAPQENIPEQVENLPEFENLNSSRLLKYLKSAPNPINIDNVEERVDAATCLDLLKEAQSPAEKEMSSKIRKAEELLKPAGKLDLLQINDSSRFNSELEYLQQEPIGMSKENAAAVLRGWECVAAIRDKAKRLLSAEERITAEIKGEKPGTMDSLTDTLKNQIGKIGERWDKWSGTEKLIFAAGALFSGIWFMKSQNETVDKIRGYLKTGAIALGGAYVLNKAFELISGKSLTDRAESLKDDTHSKYFFEKAFGTDENHADLIAKSFSMLGNDSLIELANKYSRAKSDGSQKVEGTSMKSDEAYQALEVFFHRFGLERLKKEYSNDKFKTPISYNQAAVIEMSNDKDIKMADNIGSQVVEKVGNGLERAYNAVMSTGAGEKFREKYQEYFHKEPTKKEIADFGLRFSTTVKENSEINGAIDNKIEAGNVQAAKYFKETFAGTTRDQLTGVKYGEKDDGYTYIIGEHEMVSKISDHEKLIGALEQNTNEMEKFAAQKYNTKIEDVKKNFEVLGSVFVAKTGKVEYFGRYKR